MSHPCGRHSRGGRAGSLLGRGAVSPGACSSLAQLSQAVGSLAGLLPWLWDHGEQRAL